MINLENEISFVSFSKKISIKKSKAFDLIMRLTCRVSRYLRPFVLSLLSARWEDNNLQINLLKSINISVLRKVVYLVPYLISLALDAVIANCFYTYMGIVNAISSLGWLDVNQKLGIFSVYGRDWCWLVTNWVTWSVVFLSKLGGFFFRFFIFFPVICRVYMRCTYFNRRCRRRKPTSDKQRYQDGWEHVDFTLCSWFACDKITRLIMIGCNSFDSLSVVLNRRLIKGFFESRRSCSFFLRQSLLKISLFGQPVLRTKFTLNPSLLVFCFFHSLE